MSHEPFTMSITAQQIKLAVLWVLPTPLEIFIYVFITAVAFALSNVSFIRDVLFAPSDFNLQTAVLGSINDLLQRLVGERIAASLSLAFFWGLVGMLVYVVLWLGQNFSTEFSNDLAMTKYVHPRGADPASPLRNFISLTMFRIVIFIIFVFYINLCIRVLVPLWLTQFRDVIQNWPKSEYFLDAAMAAAGQIVMLHGTVVFARLLFLRKRLFT